MSGGPVRLSVVMPVHRAIDPAHLRRAIQSIAEQTYPADELIVVEDGPLKPAHHEVVAAFASGVLPLRRAALAVNSGAGAANQVGLLAAQCDWVAKMDADDVSLPERFERQAGLLATGEYDLIGSAMAEFSTDESDLIGVRASPLDQGAILKRLKLNNPFLHSTTIFRRSLAVKVGGYHSVRMEDYDLFARMLMAGARARNLPDALVLFRADENMLRRRGARNMVAREFVMQRRLHEYGVVSAPRAVVNLSVRSAFRLLPYTALRAVYRRAFLTDVEKT